MGDVSSEFLSALQGSQVAWELREDIWSVEGVFEDEPVQVIRILNPFGPTPAALS
jgi:hypothetical protein